MYAFTSVAKAQDCGTNFDIKKLRQNDPKRYAEHLRIEKFTSDYLQRLAADPNARLIDPNGIITIPVVFHVIHRGEPIGTGTNIPDARIIDQVAVLNTCFGDSQFDALVPLDVRRTNTAGSPGISFVLACKDPNGENTTGILRTQSSTARFVSQLHNAQKAPDGDNPWPTDRFLNIWVTPNISQSTVLNPTGFFDLFGYSSGPMEYASNPEDDGCVVRFDVVGRNAGNFPGRNEGRTLVHEIGHWLNLRHLYDDGCQNDDGCQDTSPQSQPTVSTITCPIIFPLRAGACPNDRGQVQFGDMYWNFMDGTNEACGRRLFTRNQTSRMRSVFLQGGVRQSFIDNYFKLYKFYQTCNGFYFVQTPFCDANTNITWSITGPATTSNFGNNSLLYTYVLPQNGANGTAILTASWNNNTTDISIPIGYGAESSYIVPTCNNDYTTSFPVRDGTNTIVCPNSYMTGELLFTGATGPATSITLTSTNSSYVYFNASGNNFTLYISDPYAYAQIQAQIPTNCGSRTVNYTFFANIPNAPNYYRISPNPANNEITISASMPVDPNNRTGNSASTPAYEVQIFNSFNQLLKKTKVKKDDRDVTIDVSLFPSNQFYTVKLISNNDVQTKSFFKQ
jgi:Pregnancy-associated plasma protein-A